MSENITHTAVTDDCARLALHSARICDAFKHCLREHLSVARLGGVTRAGDTYTADLLGKFREEWPDGAPEGMLPKKLAYVLGWLTHRAADRQMKPIWRSMPDETASPTDCSVYHDVFVLRTVYAGGTKGPYSPQAVHEVPDPPAGAEDISVQEVENLLRAIWQRALVGLHTFKPDHSDAEGWIERLIEARQEWRVDITRYARAFADPDPDKVRRYIEEINFYDPDEPLIRLARSLQAGEADPSVDLDQALRPDAVESKYGLALRRGFGYLDAASSFFQRDIADAELRERLDIGKSGG
jgi:hypothetical protein